jgi:hypothetical protein
MHPIRLLLVILLFFVCVAAAADAGEEKPEAAATAWSAELRLKRFVGSHTSYEFGNPFDPYQAPLSRLEFPLNTWWAGAEIRRSFPRLSAGLEVLRNISRESDNYFRDSDWDDDSRTWIKTIYSESSCRMEPSYMVRGDLDMKVADWMGLPLWFDLRPVVGIRWQRLEMVAYNGLQSYPAPGDDRPPEPLSGDGIRFEQTYWQYFLGLRAAYDLGRHWSASDIKLHCQLDWAYVEGSNRDHHLLRSGNRYTYEKTRGDAWHALLGLKVGIAENIRVGVEAEYLLIRTTGSHRLENDLFDLVFGFDHGVKVWSEQISLMTSLEYRF